MSKSNHHSQTSRLWVPCSSLSEWSCHKESHLLVLIYSENEFVLYHVAWLPLKGSSLPEVTLIFNLCPLPSLPSPVAEQSARASHSPQVRAGGRPSAGSLAKEERQCPRVRAPGAREASCLEEAKKTLLLAPEVRPQLEGHTLRHGKGPEPARGGGWACQRLAPQPLCTSVPRGMAAASEGEHLRLTSPRPSTEAAALRRFLLVIAALQALHLVPTYTVIIFFLCCYEKSEDCECSF